MDCSPPGSSVHGISRQEDWSGLPFPFPRDPPNPRVEPGSPALQADSLPIVPPKKLMLNGVDTQKKEVLEKLGSCNLAFASC